MSVADKGSTHLVLQRASAVWLVLMTGEVIHGTLRTLFVEPLIGSFVARQLSVFSGSALMLGVAYLFIRWIGTSSARQRIAVGLLWLAFTLAFELGVGHYVFGLPWERLVEDFDLLHGGLLPIGLVILTLSPLIAARWRGVQDQPR